MTLLTEAMNNVISPYIPARPEWLEGWCGPAVASVDGVDWDASLVAVFGGGVNCAVHTSHGGTLHSFLWPDIRLDLTRPEVRDLLIRRGAPAWARDIPAALWVWATAGSVLSVDRWKWLQDFREPGWFSRGRGDVPLRVVTPSGWWCSTSPLGTRAAGPETGDAGREAADRAALAHGCILTEPGGYIVPTPTGPGWWPEEQA